MSTTTKSVFTGVDYIRMTATDHAPYDHWQNMLHSEYIADKEAGRKPHFRWVLGYYGQVTEHAFLGKGEHGTMLQMSGALAWERWKEAGRYSERCTRLDLQVTWPIDGEPGQYIRDMYEVAQLRKKREGHQPELQLTDTPKGAKMLTVGSRTSEVYGRMYDKGRESGLQEYASCVRWEVESKGHTAKDLNTYMREQDASNALCRTIVRQWWTERGMEPFWEDYEYMDQKPPTKRSRTDETKIAWLKGQVGPVIRTLKDHGKLETAIRALLDETLTTEQIDRLLLALYNELDG